MMKVGQHCVAVFEISGENYCHCLSVEKILVDINTHGMNGDKVECY